MSRVKLQGIAASDGIAIAAAYKLIAPSFNISRDVITDHNSEIEKLDLALSDSKNDLINIKSKASKNLSEQELEVFDAHMMILDDPDFIGEVKSKIINDSLNADFALNEVANQFIEMFNNMDNEYMRERAADIKDVRTRVLAHILNVKLPDAALIDKETIVVANDLTPSDTAQLDKEFVKGFATEVGGRTSHSAIMARSLEIPAVVGVKDLLETVKDNETIIVDGINGEVIIGPDNKEIKYYQKLQQDFMIQKDEWEKLKNEPTKTKDGKHYDLAANIGTPKDVRSVIENGAEGIGLFRSEFLYMDSATLPDEDTQFEAYKYVLESMGDKPVIVRTMDIGGDKELPYLPLEKEMNPFLGYRAIRISLQEEEIFKTQLRALLRASAFGKLRIMFPMIATVDEFKRAKAVYNSVKTELQNAKVNIDNSIEVGMMMEIPAAVALADQFAKEADFFSIGTNDLIQYTMAADRGNEKVSYLYQPYNPAVLRLINSIIEASHKEGKWTGMCGEAAGDPNMIPFLLGMGLDEYSMSATSVLKIRSLMAKIDTKDLGGLVNEALNVNTSNKENLTLAENFLKNLK